MSKWTNWWERPNDRNNSSTNTNKNKPTAQDESSNISKKRIVLVIGGDDDDKDKDYDDATIQSHSDSAVGNSETANAPVNRQQQQQQQDTTIGDCFSLSASSSLPPPPASTSSSPLDWITKLFKRMGSCISRATGAEMVIANADGDEEAFHKRFIEDRVLGEGEFGVVNLVYDMTEAPPTGGAAEANTALACKTLRKGVVFKDNTFYAPLKPEALQAEVNILRKLAGNHYCLGLKGVYETNRVILMVTEYCAGGEMMEYISKQEEDLRTEDVSRICFQLIDALAHCAKHNVLHRDIKPENLMFMDSSPGSELRVIDFGSGTDVVVEGEHTTFAGSAFYTSPEMFQRTYTIRTDVWSAGVTLYVLVAGYPADVLQKAFNLMQTSQERNLRDLPNLPAGMPDSYYDMLDGMLVYRHKKRKDAKDLLSNEFVQFHKTAAANDNKDDDDAIADLTTGKPQRHKRTHSISIRGSVTRHSMFLDYQKFERSLTTLLATMLDKPNLQELLDAVEKRKKVEEDESAIIPSNQHQLDVIELNELKEILVEQQQNQALSMLAKLPNSDGYAKFAYHVSLLKEFSQDADGKSGTPSTRRRGSFRGNNAKLVRDSSVRSAGSMRGRHSMSGSNRGNVNTSVHGGGGGVYQEWKKKGLNNPRKKKARSKSGSA
eukprot:CAMPEP_0119557602 /NCGR_PEP_ID=MMETSP1352-20130426/9227_1 /TAXON_ID=265584 /ORGANISM="Stauroneis constricta, Strain CCMP1120" /LENGTH=659 /DNA_ID=CAMNT_0007604735 /DNA_START=100 /DNA_END=2079 /DNA_ORIENTATION=+